MPYLWRRFIDDVLFFWRGTEESLLQFLAHLNASHATIKFECKPGESYNFVTRSINFLDLTKLAISRPPCSVSLAELSPISSPLPPILPIFVLTFPTAYRLKRI